MESALISCFRLVFTFIFLQFLSVQTNSEDGKRNPPLIAEVSVSEVREREKNEKAVEEGERKRAK